MAGFHFPISNSNDPLPSDASDRSSISNIPHYFKPYKYVFAMDSSLWLLPSEYLHRTDKEVVEEKQLPELQVEHKYEKVVFRVSGGRWILDKNTDFWYHSHSYNYENDILHNDVCLLCGEELPEGIKIMGSLQKMHGEKKPKYSYGKVTNMNIYPSLGAMLKANYPRPVPTQHPVIAGLSKSTYPILKRKIVIAER